MQGERDELAKRVFPQLREICEDRGVAFSDVDLRWGVTDEQRAEGNTLPICLDEIRECRPYFIGVLGERYGWIPEAVPDELAAREPWLAEHRDCSVTELEIWHGVLTDPAAADRSFFYFRDPGYVENLPAGAHADDFRSEGPAQAKRLAGLKERIRKSGLPVREGYRDPPEFGSLVFEDLRGEIEQLFPRDATPSPLEREALLHRAFEDERNELAGGLGGYEALVREHLAGDGPPLVVTGDAGLGKSTLLARVAREIEKGKLGSLVAPGAVIAHYAAASPRGGWQAMVIRLTAELARRAGRATGGPCKEPGELRAAFADMLLAATDRGRLALILDGLEMLIEGHEVPDLSWLPSRLPGSVRLLASSRPGPVLDELRKRGWAVVEVAPLAQNERQALIERLLERHGKTLADERMARITDAAATANPLYLRTLLEELLVVGRHEMLDAQIDRLLAAPDLPRLLDQVLARYEDDYGAERPAWVGEALSLLWASRRGLSEAELRDLLGPGNASLRSAVWSPFYAAARHFLAARAGLVALAHRPVLDAVERRYLSRLEDRAGAHGKLADYFRTRFERTRMGEHVWAMAVSVGRPLHDARRIEEVPWQLARAGRFEDLAELLTDWIFVRELSARNPFELRSYWQQIEASSPLRRDEVYRRVLENPADYAPVLVTVGELLREGGHVERALELAERATSTLRVWGDEQAQGAMVGLRGVLLCDLGRLDEAANLLAQQEETLRERGNALALAHSLVNRALIAIKRAAPDDADTALSEAETIARQANDRRLLATALMNRAAALRQLGDADGSWTRLEEAEQLARLLDDPHLLAGCLSQRSRILEDRGELGEALDLAREAEASFRRAGNLSHLMASLQNRAEIHRKRGESEEALRALSEKERLCRQTGDRAGLARCLSSRAQVLLAQGELDAAVPALEEHEALWRELSGDSAAPETYYDIADSLLEIGAPEAADKALDWRAAKARSAGDEQMLARLLLLRGSIVGRELAQPAAALPLIEEARALCESLGLLSQVKLADELKARFQDAGSDRREARLGAEFSDEVLALFQEGLSHGRNREPEAAIAAFDRCLALAPGFAPALHERGACKQGLGDTRGSIDDLNEAIRLAPEHYGSWLMRGFAELGERLLDQAIADGEEALKRNATCADAQLLLAMALSVRSTTHGWFKGSARREDTTRGLEHLARALDLGYSRLAVVASNPMLEPLRRDPRYRQIAARYRIP